MHRLLKPVIFTLLCIAIGFAIIALIYKDGVVHQTSYIIEADQQDVWAAFTNTEEMPKWMHGLAEVRNIQGQYGQEGAVVDFVYLNESGVESTIRERITKIDELKQFDFEGENDEFLMSGSVLFEMVPDGTLVTQDLTHKGKTWYWRAIAPMMESVFKTSSEGLYANLKRHVESGNVEYDTEVN